MKPILRERSMNGLVSEASETLPNSDCSTASRFLIGHSGAKLGIFRRYDEKKDAPHENPFSAEEQAVELAPGKSHGDTGSDTTDQSDITYTVHRMNDDDGSSATRFTAVVERATETPTWAFDEDAVS